MAKYDGLQEVVRSYSEEYMEPSPREYAWLTRVKVDCFCLTDRFDEQPVFPDEATGLLVDSSVEKLATTWGSLKID